jgi:hypothetical protein
MTVQSLKTLVAQAERFELPQVAVDPSDGGLLALRGGAFVRGFKPPEPVVEAIPATGLGRLVALTGPTGHGKTTLGAHLQVCIAAGLPFADQDVMQGRVLVLCGENPDDYCLHLIGQMQDAGLEPADLDALLVVPSRFAIDHEFEQLEALVERFGDLTAVFVDTSAAFFLGADDNSNTDQLEHASKLRRLTTLPGRPAVFVLCHPVKNAGRENLLPRGGGAFLNEVDANLTVWKDEAGVVTLAWAGKMRGPNFDPLRFELQAVRLAGHPDAKGRASLSVVVRHLADERAEQLQARAMDDEDLLLTVMQRKPNATVRELALACGWTSATAQPSASRVDRRLRTLADKGLVEQDRRRTWRLTSKGSKEASLLR